MKLSTTLWLVFALFNAFVFAGVLAGDEQYDELDDERDAVAELSQEESHFTKTPVKVNPNLSTNINKNTLNLNQNQKGVLRGAEANQKDNKEVVGIDDGSFGERSTSFLDGLSSSFMMILVSEIGDETFIIAAIMAMRQNRGIVLLGALSALYAMTIISTAMGYVVPNLLNKQVAANLATGLYIFFGLRLFYIAYNSNDEVEEEIEEVEEMLNDRNQGNNRKPSGVRGKIRKFFAQFCTPLFLEAFILTFSAEWGDRSQIATIALAAHKNPYAVTIGACAGHTICTSIAVWGGRLIAAKISQRTVAIAGGITFFVFAAWNVLVGFHAF